MHIRRDKSCHYIDNNKKMVRVQRVNFCITFSNCHYHHFEIDIDNLCDIDSGIPVNAWVECLMLPKLDITGKAVISSKAEYTIIYDNWMVIGINGKIQQS